MHRNTLLIKEGVIMKYEYTEPQFNVIVQKCEDILTTSGGEDFNMRGDQPHSVYYKNTNWTIEI